MAEPLETKTTNQLIADLLAALTAQQASQQAAQTTGQQQSAQGSRGITQESVVGSEIAETGMGERAQLDNAGDSAAWRINQKALFDDFRARVEELRSSLNTELSRSQGHIDNLRAVHLNSFNEEQKFLTRVSTNAASADHIATMQAVAHRDIAIEDQWQQPGEGVAESEPLRAVREEAAKPSK